MAGGTLEQAIALDRRKFIACGGAGVLVKDVALGDLVVVSAAVRDEGFSYHYMKPGRELVANPTAVGGLSEDRDGVCRHDGSWPVS